MVSESSNEEVDIDNQFNKPKRHLTKEQILYGIWAESDEEEDVLTSKHNDVTLLNEPIQFIKFASSINNKKNAIGGFFIIKYKEI